MDEKLHQIMVIVGNGFDTSVLFKYGDNITTSYESFYRFFQYHYPNEKDNIFIEQMEKSKLENKKDWSDFEAILSIKLQEISSDSNEDINKLSSDLSKLQQAFSRATPHKDHILYFVRVLLAYFPSPCTIRPSKASALRRPHCAI